MIQGAFLLAVLCGSPFPAAAQDLSSANGLYESAHYTEAAEAYREMIKKEGGVAALHYNLGNAYFKTGFPGSLGRAIASYMRAFELDPRDADIRYNLKFALGRAGERLVPAGTPPALHALFHFLSATELAAFHWLGFWLALLLGSLFLLKESLQKRLGPWLAGAVFFWSFFACWWGARTMMRETSPGVVILQDAEVRSGPGETFPVSFKLPEGRLISRIGHNGKWVEVGIPTEGLKGWVESDAIEGI